MFAFANEPFLTAIQSVSAALPDISNNVREENQSTGENIISHKHKSAPDDTADQGMGVIKTPVITLPNGVKNSNPIIEDAINDFTFLYSKPKPKGGKIQFSKNQTIIFDEDEEVDKLINKHETSENAKTFKPILKPGPVFIRTPELFEIDDVSYLEDNKEANASSLDDQNVNTVLRRIFELHGIPLDEIKEDTLETLQRLTIGVVESFKQREQCYKYVGRQQCIEEIDELEYANDNLKCEVVNLNKNLNTEKVKWEVVDQAFAENDLLKAKVYELTSAAQHLTKELQLTPKWEDVDGLLEEDKELKAKIDQLAATNKDLKERYNKMQETVAKSSQETDKLSRLAEEYEKHKYESISSKEKTVLELKDTAVKLEMTSKQVQDLRKDKNQLITKLNTVEEEAKITKESFEKEKAYVNKEFEKTLGEITIKLEKAIERVEGTSRLVEDNERKNADLVASHGRLLENTEQTAAQLKNIEAANVKLVFTNDELTLKLSVMKESLEDLTAEKIGMLKKMKSMKKKVYNHYFDQNIGLASKNEEFSEKLEQALIKLERFGNLQKEQEELVSKNNELTTGKEELVAANINLSQRFELEVQRAQKLELDISTAQEKIKKLEFNLIQAEQWYETSSLDRREADVKICQLEKCFQRTNSHFAEVNQELNSTKDISSQRLQKIEQLNHRIKRDEHLIQNAERWKREGELCIGDLNSLQNEHMGLLQKLGNLESELSKTQEENADLSGYRESYALFDEKYEWLESMALSLKQEKETSDRQIKYLQRQLKQSKKTIESMQKVKAQYEKRPIELKTQLDQLLLENFELCQRLNDREEELQGSLNHMQEMSVMLRGTMSLARTLSPADEVTLVDQNSGASNSLKNLSPLKWWKTSEEKNQTRFLSRSVV